MDARYVETQQERVDRLLLEVSELLASRRRLVRAADADRRWIERALHDGVQQHLIALAVNLQLAATLAATDPGETDALLDQLGRDVQRALEETAELAQRIYPPLLEAGGLGPALRVAATSAGIRVSLDVEVTGTLPSEVASTVYLCCLEALAHAEAGATVAVRGEKGALAFEIETDGNAPDTAFDSLRDRVEALGGRLTINTDGGTRVSGSLPR